MDIKIKHLEMIQSIIQRMANNSFLLKGWTVSLIVAIFALADKEMSQKYFLISYIPVIAFWLLDSYYLQLERKYAVLYDQVHLDKKTDLSLRIDDINFNKTKDKKIKYRKCFFSRSEILFYFPILIVLTFIYKSLILKIFI